MAQSAKNNTETAVEKTASNVSAIGKRAVRGAGEAAHAMADRVEGSVADARGNLEVVTESTVEAGRELGRQSVQGLNEIGQVFTELASEQSRHGLETFRALASTVDWSQAARIQGDFLRTSTERMLEFARRYLQIMHSLNGAAVATAGKQAESATTSR